MQKPNILFLFPDQHRGDWLPQSDMFRDCFAALNGNLKLPNIKKLIQTGTTFTRAVTSSPLCAPARACLAYGVRYNKSGVYNNCFDCDPLRKTFYRQLKENGYSVCGVGKFDLHKKTPWWGLNGFVESLEQMGFTHAIDNAGKIDAAIQSGSENPRDPYMSFLKTHGLAELYETDIKKRGSETYPAPLPDYAYSDNWITSNALQLLDLMEDSKPWFMQVNFNGPHDPWDITEKMKKSVEDLSFDNPIGWQGTENINEIQQNYAAMLENIDYNIGIILDKLKSKNQFQNTLIIYSSDHGEMMGEFSYFSKCKPYKGSIHIPMIFSGLDVPKNKRNNALVELNDLASTILEYAGAGEMQEAVDSISLKYAIDEKVQTVRVYQISDLLKININMTNAFPGFVTIVDGNYKFVKNEDNEILLYDLNNDCYEQENIAYRQENETVIDRFTDILNKYLAEKA